MKTRQMTILVSTLVVGLVVVSGLIPSLPATTTQAQAMEHPPLVAPSAAAHRTVAQQPYPHAWGIEPVDSGGTHSSLALAPTAPYTPHISYAGDSLEYAIHDGSSWIPETVDSARVWGGTALALAPTRPCTPSIAYYDADSDVLKYARWTGSGWSVQTVDSVGDQYWGISLALEPTSPYAPHIAYIGSGNLKYARWTGSGWSIETVDTKTDSFWYLESPSLALSSSTPHAPFISYHDLYRGYVRLARRVGSAWTTEDVVYSMNSSGDTSLALDAAGHPHIAYNEWSNYYLKYARWTGSAWDIETVDQSGHPSLALDSNDQPRIGYTVDNELRYAYRGVGGWATEVVGSLANSTWYAPSLALDGNGYPRMSYHDDGLRYAYYYILTYAISGQVTDAGGDPMAGAVVSAGSGGSATTDATGAYTISDLAPGSYTLAPSRAGCLFTPSARTVSVPPDANGQDFQGRCEFDISGQVTDGSGNPFVGVHISASGEHIATTDVSGQYTFTDLLSGTYVLTPTLPGYAFQPAVRIVSVPPDATGQDFAILSSPVSMTLPLSGTANLPAALSYADTQGLTTTLNFAAGTVTETTTLVLTPTLATGRSGFVFAGHAFEIAAFRGGHLVPHLSFNEPVTVTIHYSAQDVRLVSDENQLALWRWTGGGWEDAADTCDPPSTHHRNLADRVLSVPICHLSLFSLLGPTHQIYLPSVLRAS